jgi:4-cresol dehydrogenase (hydroxylating)
MLADDLTDLLKNSVVSVDKQELQLTNTATFETSTSSSLIVKTRTITDVVLLLQFCNRNAFKLSVISCGKNWGFGSKVPVQSVDILLDLSLMNSIISYDDAYGAVRIEPGVTFRQLSDYLKNKGNKHFLNSIGGDPDASVMGNIIERGDGVGPYCERSEYACSPEVVLADGEMINIGFGNFERSAVSDLSKAGLGPNFQEIFFQSNYGVVTKISIWLCAVPQNFKSFHFSLREDHQLSKVLDKMKTLYQKRILTTPVTFWNDYKQIVNAIQMPWAVKSHLSLDRSAIKKISNNYKAWYAFGGIYIDHPVIARQTIKEIFACLHNLIEKPGALSVISKSKLNLLRFSRLFRKKSMPGNPTVFGLSINNPLLGDTADDNTRSLFWRKKMLVPGKTDPALIRCGLYWNAFVLPFDGDIISSVILKIDQIVFKHGFEPTISLVLLNDRYIKVFQQLIFDRETQGEEIRASACHQELFQYLEISGYSHSRLDILSMNQDSFKLKSYYLNQKLKKALDPNGVLSPGKYFSS